MHITDSCNAKCLHCAFNCGPEIEGCMELEKARSYVSEAKALDTGIVCITSGEPMIYLRFVKEIVSECNRLSIPEIWLFTNGFWANNLSRACTITENLKAWGLTKVFLSVDVFHQGYIPIEFIKNAIEALLEADLEVCIAFHSLHRLISSLRGFGEPSTGIQKILGRIERYPRSTSLLIYDRSITIRARP